MVETENTFFKNQSETVTKQRSSSTCFSAPVIKGLTPVGGQELSMVLITRKLVPQQNEGRHQPQYYKKSRTDEEPLKPNNKTTKTL